MKVKIHVHYWSEVSEHPNMQFVSMHSEMIVEIWRLSEITDIIIHVQGKK